MDNGACSYRRFVKGDDEALVEIIRDYKDGLIFFLNRYVNNMYLAEELAEETFYKIAIKKPHFKEKYSFKTWLYTIGRNIAINYLKRADKISNVPIEDIKESYSEIDAMEKAYIREEEKLVVYKALANIKADYSKVLYLKYFEDLDNEQIAYIMKKNKRQIENLIYQAKQSLKTELEKEGYVYEEL